MSDQVPVHFQQEYSSGITLLAQQLMSETRMAVTETAISSKKASDDQIGTVRLQPKTTRHADIPSVNTPSKRRWVTATRFHARDFIDEEDKLQTLNDPTNGYTQAFAAAAAREYDYRVVRGILGTNFVGEEGTDPVVLPSSQIIPDGGTGYTLPKLKTAVKILKQNHAIQKGDEIHAFWTAAQEDEFINTTEVKSSDFNRTKVLVEGGVDEFYRVKFHLLDDIDDNDDGRMLPKEGTVRQCPLWVKRGVWVGLRKAPYGTVNWLDEKEAWQVTGGLSIGATRKQEKLVVRVDVQEPA